MGFTLLVVTIQHVGLFPTGWMATKTWRGLQDGQMGVGSSYRSSYIQLVNCPPAQ